MTNEQTVTEARREQVLERYLAARAQQGYRVVSRSATSAQLVKPKTFSLGFAFLWFLVGVGGLIVYLLYYVSKRDRQHQATVDEQGRVWMFSERGGRQPAPLIY